MGSNTFLFLCVARFVFGVVQSYCCFFFFFSSLFFFFDLLTPNSTLPVLSVSPFSFCATHAP